MPTPIRIAAGDLQIFETYLVPLYLAVLVVLLVLATTVDIRERRIPNWLVACGMVSAVTFHALSSKGEGAAFALLGLAVGMAMFLPMYAFRVMGAGDVKLMGMIGAFLGMHGVLGAALASMAAGGLLAIGFAVSKHMLPQMLGNVRGIVVRHQINRMTGGMAGSMPPAPSI